MSEIQPFFEHRPTTQATGENFLSAFADFLNDCSVVCSGCLVMRQIKEQWLGEISLPLFLQNLYGKGIGVRIQSIKLCYSFVFSGNMLSLP